MKNAWVVVGILVAFLGTVYLWGVHRYKDGYEQGRAGAVDSATVNPVTVTLRDTVFLSQGGISVASDRPRINQDARSHPETTRDTLSVPVVSQKEVVLRNDSVQVRANLTTTYYPRTMMFQHDFQGVRVSYPRQVVWIDKIEYRGPYWWEKPVLALATVGTVVCIKREEWAGAAAFGSVGLIVLTVDF